MEHALWEESQCDLVTEAGVLEPQPRILEVTTKWPEVGTVLGGYTLVKVLGTGGAGRVFRAISQRPEDLGRPVAMKVSRRLDDSPVPCQVDLVVESQRTSALRHPNIVDVYRVGQQGPYCYSLMEWIDGMSLSQNLKKNGQWTVEQTIEVGVQICEALSYLHGDLTHGPKEPLLHCDLKPANIMVDRFGVVKLIDFGVCRRMTEHVPKDKVVYGTPAYMAPEQLMRQPLSRSTDIFAVGTVLMELASGQRLFAHKNIQELLAQRVGFWESKRPWSKVPKPTTGCAIFDRILTKCTEPLSLRRFQTAAALGRSLKLLRAHRASKYAWLL